MGKRSKASIAIEDIKVNKKLKQKKTKNENIQSASATEEFEPKPIALNISETQNAKKKNKKHRNKNKSESSDKEIEEKVCSTFSKIETVESSSLNKIAKTKQKNKICPQTNELTENNVIETAEDEHIEVSNEKNKVTKKARNTESLQEDDVEDEDIDKFCDEITQEDNKKYENWVKLIEAKLNGFKEKPK